MNTQKNVLIVLGTRPEAIKLLSVILAFKANDNVNLTVCSTGQHREMLKQILGPSGVTPDIDMDMMEPGQSSADICRKIMAEIPAIFERTQPDLVLVQGDTTTVFATAQAAFFQKIPVAHLEAGLRSYNRHQPWPEEDYRRMVSIMAELHFAPTEQARKHLLREKIPDETIFVTGNTVIDALKLMLDRIANTPAMQETLASSFPHLTDNKKHLLITTHRRENQQGGIARICAALKTLAEQRDDITITVPVHLNPKVRSVVFGALEGVQNVHLIEPQEYVPFLYLMSQATLLISDSGGVQEEGPFLKKPVLVLREATERPEGIDAGVAKLVGTDEATIVREANHLLDNEASYDAMTQAQNLYGDGQAAARVLDAVLHGKSGQVMEFKAA